MNSRYVNERSGIAHESESTATSGREEGGFRIGQLYPSGGLCDDELGRMAPDNIRFLTTRLPFRRTNLQDDAELAKNVEFHASLVADAKVDLIAFNCTAASMVSGPETINRRIEAATGIRSITTIEAVLEALTAARIRRLALMAPYPPEVVAAEVAYLQERGFEVVATTGEPCGDPVAQGSIPPSRWFELSGTVRSGVCDGLLVSCAGIRLAPVLGAMEKDFGRPVIASNQALLWSCLRRLEISHRPKGYGALLEGVFDPS